MGSVCDTETLLTPTEAQTWAQKVPALLRQHFAAGPDAANQVDTGPLNGNLFKVLGISVGAILGISTLTKWVPAQWKWLSGAAAIGSIAAGFHYGHVADKSVSAVKYAIPEMKKAILAYADAIESNSALREQLATHLAAHVTAKETSFRPLEFAVLGKAMEFGRTTSYLDTESISNNVLHTWRCTENPAREEYVLAR